MRYPLKDSTIVCATLPSQFLPVMAFVLGAANKGRRNWNWAKVPAQQRERERERERERGRRQPFTISRSEVEAETTKR
jgi:hypothetical protein